MAALLAKPTAGDDALVLRTWPSGEASVIASLLTRNHGFVKVIAKSARRSRSQLRPLVQAGRLTAVEFSLVAGRDLQYLRGGSVLLDPLGPEATLERSAFLLGALELVDRCRPGDNDTGSGSEGNLFAICEEYVRVLSSAACQAPDLLFFALEWEMLAGQGMAPELSHCTSCGQGCSGTVTGALWFNPGEGGVVCGQCAGAGGKPLSAPAHLALLELSRQGLGVDVADPLSGALRRELGANLHRFLGYHLPGYRLPTALDLLRPVRPREGPVKE